eukprot:TRINITY_DN93072_c0_g1_i1.p1 TRINITY_DN93072_c0_g1~~TRINITY_DN93072_c0_g1_i1.p1  ORF type:complete len:605 (-),score=159.14 TRINITY_DN93072_c0_g1_i1:142-1812(-)
MLPTRGSGGPGARSGSQQARWSAAAPTAHNVKVQFDAMGSTGMTIGERSVGRLDLLTKLERSMGHDFRERVAARLIGVEQLLSPLFAALPKRPRGGVGSESVRYVLSRLLRERRAWLLGGLQDADPDTPADSPSWVARLLVPHIVQTNSTVMSDIEHSDEDCSALTSLMEGRIARGADLMDVSVLTAVVEELVHSDMRGKLKAAYLERGVPLEAKVNVSQADDLIDLSVISFLRGRNISYWSQRLVKHMQETIAILYPPWPQTQEYMRELRKTLDLGVTDFDFEAVAKVVEEATDRFGHWHNDDCQGTKRNLLELEEADSGRVRLLDFYRAALHQGKYEFTESMEYLRQSGALDESDPKVPRVIIANYVMGPSNCVARTGHYSVCCLDECEEILEGLERHLRKPQAAPDEVLAAMQTLPGLEGSRVPAPPADGSTHGVWLREKLEEIASQHGGQVPIHGRLAAQWMHFAYPRHCGYAHPKGTTPAKAVSMEQWEIATGLRSAATVKELQEAEKTLAEAAAEREAARDPAALPPDSPLVFTGMWTTSPEELYASMEL